LKELTETQKAWLAGIIDGEGYIGIVQQPRKDTDKKFNYTLVVKVASTDAEMIPTCFEWTGIGNVGYKESKNPKWADARTWQIANRQAKYFLEAIEPYLIVKKNQARVALEFHGCKKHWHHATESDLFRQYEYFIMLKDLKNTLVKSI